MAKIHYCFYIICLMSICTSANSQNTAKQILQKAIKTMGSGWDTVKTLAYEQYANQFVVDQSERSEGPYIPAQNSRSLSEDIVSKKVKITESTEVSFQTARLTYFINGSDLAYKTGKTLTYYNGYDELRSYTSLAPEFVFQTALQDPNVKLLKDTIVQKAPQYVISFKYMNYPVKVYINKETGFLTATEIIRPFQSGLGGYSRVWGDAHVVSYYSFWDFLSDGIHYPLQRDSYLNDYYLESAALKKWQINIPLSTDSLTIPDSVIQKGKASLASQKITLRQPVEIAKDVWLIQGPCNSTIIKQDDGIVIVESGSSSAYGEALLVKVKELYPANKIKAFVTTADAWLHLGGIRSMATTDATIYFPFRNETLIKKILDAPYISQPDLLAKKGKGHYKLIPVKEVTTIGNGKNQIQLYPYNTETGDRMMMVYFPEHKIVYCSDLFQPKLGNGKYWQPHYTWEVINTIRKYKIPATQLYAMHQAKLLSVEDIAKDFPEEVK